MPRPTPILPTLTALYGLRTAYNAFGKPKKKKDDKKGLDMVDRMLIGGIKVGLFAMFGLFVASKVEQRFPGTLNRVLPPTPNRPRPTPSRRFP